MRIIEITASCGRTVPHPTVAYASLKVDVSARATVDEGEEAAGAMMKLQNWVDRECKRQAMTLQQKASTE